MARTRRAPRRGRTARRGLTYARSGVDIAAIERSRGAMAPIVASTHRAGAHARVAHGFGHYAGIVRLRGGALIAAHTDGVGTKALIASQMRRYDTVGIDCIAMNVNDIACVGARPVLFVDYIAARRNDARALAAILRGLARGARAARVPIVGGETAIMPDLISGRGFAFDLAGTVVGELPRARRALLGASIRRGDAIIGIASTGLHSNGYSLARRALLGRYSLSDRPRGVGRLGDALLRPTRIYSEAVLDVLARCDVHGLAHITGGSFANLLRLRRATYEIDSLPRTPPIMELIRAQGVSDAEMYRTFNMGVGFCVISPESEAGAVSKVLRRHRMASRVIGRVAAGSSVSVNGRRIA